jgi:hypothetical protein
MDEHGRLAQPIDEPAYAASGEGQEQEREVAGRDSPSMRRAAAIFPGKERAFLSVFSMKRGSSACRTT